jgi:hypothetical protein
MENATFNPRGSRHAAGASRGLKIVMDRLSTENRGIAYRKTFFTGDEFGRTGYDIGTSPIVYPGQTMTASVFLSVGEGVTARLFVRQYGSGTLFFGDEVPLTAGEVTEISHAIHHPQTGLIDRAGIAFSAAQGTTAVAYLDRVDWSGAPNCTLDLSVSNPMFGWGYLRGRWFGRGGALNGSHYGKDAEAYTGLLDWEDYCYEARLRPHCGQRHRILFRVRGAQRSYAFGLAPGGRVAFEKNWQGYKEVASAPFEWALQGEYTLAVEVVGNRMTGFVDGVKVLEWQDPDDSWPSGCVGLGVKDGRTMFYSASLRPVE